MTPHPAGLQAEDMFHNVLVGVGDYEGGRDALELATTLMSSDGRITLVFVEVLQSKPAPEADTRSDAERQRFGLERLERLRDEAQVHAEVERIQAPSVRRGLHELALARAADLIVIGASRRNQVARSLLGDEVRELLDDPPCTVAVAPVGYSGGSAPIRKIGVAYDRSAESERALALARELAAERHATLSAFQAVPAPVYAHDIWNVEGEIDDDVDRARQRIAALGGVEPQAEFSDNEAEGLRRFAAAVDLLVLGAHRYRRPDHLLQHTKTQRVADDPPSPLLVLSSSAPDAGSAPQPA